MLQRFDPHNIKQIYSENPEEGFKILEIVCKEKNLYQNEWFVLRTRWNELQRNIMLGLQGGEDIHIERNRLNEAFIKLTDKLFAPPEEEYPFSQNQTLFQNSGETLTRPKKYQPSDDSVVGKIWKWLNYEDQKEILLFIGAAIIMLVSALFKGCE